MRILGIRFKNINSLAGEWDVDFTHADYTANGIFAITGPTGAGKTTLLDVICLALYGRTPRIERVNKSGNDVMTRQTGECFAEVTFSTPAGRFRCHWSQHRARKKPDGELQLPKHEISNADSERVIDNQIRTVAQRIVETTGMDFQRFTQSMMLAQGGFAAFLKASADERAPILEQITGTGIYSEISTKVHERHALEKNQLQMLEGELSGLQLLTPEQKTALRAEEQQKETECQQQQSLLTVRRNHCDWKQECVKLEQSITELTSKIQQWHQQQEAFAPKKAQLDKAIRALELSGHYSALTSLRENQRTDQQRAQQAAQAEPALQQALTTQRNSQLQADAVQKLAEKTLADMRPVFKKVHVLDSNISQQRIRLGSAEAELAQRVGQLEMNQQQMAAIQQDVDRASADLQLLMLASESDYNTLRQRLQDDLRQKQELFNKKHAEFSALSQGKSLSQWREQDLASMQQLLRCDEVARLQKEHNTLNAALETRRQQLDDISSQINQLAGDLTTAEALMAAREITLSTLQEQQNLLQTIKSLESHRTQLTDGQPCPLCGSREHPYASHAPDADVAALNARLTEATTLLEQSRRHHQVLHEKHLRLQERRSAQQTQCETEQQSLQQWQHRLTRELEILQLTDIFSLDQYRLDLLAQQKKIRQTLEQIEAGQQQMAVLEQSVGSARETLTKAEHKIALLSQQHERLGYFQRQHSTLQAQQTAAQAEQNRQQQTLEKLLAERHQLLGDNNADQMEAELEAAASAAAKECQEKLDQYRHTQQQVDANQHLQKTLAQQIIERAAKITAAEHTFIDDLRARGFDSEADYLAAALSDAERQQLHQQSEKIKESGNELQGGFKQKHDELEKLLQQALTTEPLELLQQAVDEQEKRVSQLQETLGGIRRDLNNNEQARNRQLQQAGKIDAQKAELQRWASLHELIGSANGSKYRMFAQGLTFELMISHANQQLAKMTDRYLLLRDSEQPLDLNVIDHYQAGEIRSTKNLSGGESFIVSLALALGLSRMASRNVRVDSLFLDEGFGTLDEDALDTALETLASLQQEGKLIGVISHVPALKERISTQIKVLPGTGGRSTLHGPGCQAL